MASTVMNFITYSSSKNLLVNIDMINTEESGPRFSNNNSYFLLSNTPVESLFQMEVDNRNSDFNVFLGSTVSAAIPKHILVMFRQK